LEALPASWSVMLCNAMLPLLSPTSGDI
jgi:hypothetical protein